MKPLKKKVSITLDSDLIDKIKYLSEADDRSFSQYVNMIIRKYLEPKENPRSPEKPLNHS